jgi:GH25 family lysozyme M1 (1,4-beta-N-acetylmuramidase)
LKNLAITGIAVALISSVTLFAATKSDTPEKVYEKVYNITDLAVFRTSPKETKFAPEILVKYLKSSVDPISWSSVRDIKVLEKEQSLLIAQTQANHEAIATAIDGLRPTHAGEERETRASQ